MLSSLPTYLGEVWQAAATDETRTLGATLTGIFYGGLTEELLLRWGVLTLFAWLGTHIFGRVRGRPRHAVMWGALALTAVLFGVLHLPAVVGLVPLSAPLVARTVLLNALGGLVYGWLFWRRSLEAAMLAHAATHVGMTLAVWLGQAFEATTRTTLAARCAPPLGSRAPRAGFYPSGRLRTHPVPSEWRC